MIKTSILNTACKTLHGIDRTNLYDSTSTSSNLSAPAKLVFYQLFSITMFLLLQGLCLHWVKVHLFFFQWLKSTHPYIQFDTFLEKPSMTSLSQILLFYLLCHLFLFVIIKVVIVYLFECLISVLSVSLILL